MSPASMTLPFRLHRRQFFTANREVLEAVKKLESKVDSLEKRFDGLEKKVDSLESKWDTSLSIDARCLPLILVSRSKSRENAEGFSVPIKH